MVNDVINAIGNVVESIEVAGVLFTLSADAKFRVNDVDSSFLVGLTIYPSQAAAKAAYDAEVAKAVAIG